LEKKRKETFLPFLTSDERPISANKNKNKNKNRFKMELTVAEMPWFHIKESEQILTI
jgi:hypothetical protein